MDNRLHINHRRKPYYRDIKLMKTLDIEFKQYGSERLYPINYEFVLKRGKQSPKQCRIIDYEVTYNLNGIPKKFNYVVQYDFCGQTMRENMVQATIDIATNNDWKNLTK